MVRRSSLPGWEGQFVKYTYISCASNQSFDGNILNMQGSKGGGADNPEMDQPLDKRWHSRFTYVTVRDALR